MKTLKFLSLTLGVMLFSYNAYAACQIDDQIAAEKKKIDEYKLAQAKAVKDKATAIEDYNYICLYGGILDRSERKSENTCWTCKTGKVELLHNDVSETVAPEAPKADCGIINCGNTQRIFRLFDIGIIEIGGVSDNAWDDWKTYIDAETASWVEAMNDGETKGRTERGLVRIIKQCSGKNEDKIELTEAATADCSKSCADWYTNSELLDPSNPASYAALVKAAEKNIKYLESIRDITCPVGGGPAGDDTGNNGGGQHYFVPDSTTVEETGTTTDTGSSSNSGGSVGAGAAGGGISVTAPKGSSSGGKGSWYDKAMALYKGSSASGGSGASKGMMGPGASGTGTIGGTGTGEQGDVTKKQATGINTKNTDIFQIVTKMYQYRYVAGLIGQGLSEKTTKTSAVKEVKKARGTKKPIIYK